MPANKKQIVKLIRQHKLKSLGLVLLTALIIAWWWWLPSKLFNVPYSSVVLSERGELLEVRIAKDQQWRFPPRTEIPEKFKTALITFEDKRFYTHLGVDPLALARAIKSNLTSATRVSGASTLTMQTIRLSRNNRARTYHEKLKEILLALRLEFSFDKEEILAMYCAHAPFGGNVVGLEAAAWRYFGRKPIQLSWAESALLAVLPNSPAIINVSQNRSKLKQKRDRLLKKLYEYELISELDYELALLEELPNRRLRFPSVTPHLIDTLNKSSNSAFFNTTINKDLQLQTNRAVSRVSKELQLQNINHTAALVIDNRSLKVKAYVGNSQYNHKAHSGYGIDLIHRPRSSGSIFKPLLFAAMIEEGQILPSTLVPDLPTQYSGYSPQNYDREYRGAIEAKYALAQSLNIPAVRLLQRYGVNKFYDFLTQSGISTLHRPPEEYGLPLILGGAETSLWDIAQVYANLASITQTPGQKYYQPMQLISKAVGQPIGEKEISQGSAWITLDALLEVSRPGNENYWKNFQSSQKIAWKSGTSYGLRDGWAIGVTPKWTVAVWVGNANGQGVPGLTGVGAAAPLMFEIFNFLERSRWFEIPLHDLKEVEVCKDNGFLSNGLCESESQLIAKNSHFDRLTPHHQLIHIDKNTGKRVHSDCEQVANMIPVSQFILPPGQEFYYQRMHSDYRAMPEFRHDCLVLSASESKSPMAFLYPNKGTQVYIPRKLDGSISQVVLEVAHRSKNAKLYWHVDDEYIGMTHQFHQQPISIEAGWHELTVVDDKGFSIKRQIRVLN